MILAVGVKDGFSRVDCRGNAGTPHRRVLASQIAVNAVSPEMERRR